MKRVIAYSGKVKEFRRNIHRLQEAERKSFSAKLLRGTIEPTEWLTEPEKYYEHERQIDTFELSAGIDRMILDVSKFKYDRSWING